MASKLFADLAFRRLQDACDALKERRLPAPVAPEDPDRLPLGYFELDVLQGPEVVMRHTSRVKDPLFQGRVLLLIEPESLRDLVNFDR